MQRCSTSSCCWSILAVWLSHGLSRGGGVALGGFLGNLEKEAEKLLPSNLTETLRKEKEIAKERLHHMREELREDSHDITKNFTQTLRKEESLARQNMHNVSERLKQRLHDKNSSSMQRLNGFLGTIRDEAGVVKEEVNAGLTTVEDKLQSKAEEWLNIEEQNKLGGRSKSYNNGVLALLVAAVTLSGLIGHAVDIYLFPQWYRARGHPRGWVIGVILCAYIMLFPALQSILFSFNIFFNIPIKDKGAMGYNVTREPVTESMLSVVNLLFKTGGQVGAYLVILYAMVMPAIKVVFLVLGELWRNSDSEIFRNISSICIFLVQVTSKWASPDMFAYILLLFLIRNVDHSPYMLSTAKLDVGFQCFTVFCLCSTFSTLAIHRPETTKREQQPSAPTATPFLLQCGGKRGALLVVSLLGTAFLVLLLIGMFTPCMGLDVDTNILVEPKGPVPKSMVWMLEDAIDKFKLRPWLHAEVSMFQCIAALAQWSFTGEAASILAFLLLAVFVVALSVMDMLVLAAVTLTLETPNCSPAMQVSHVFKHISMLDVFCMGVYVVCLAGQAYSSQGFGLSLRPGIYSLLGAEIVHYITFYLVSGAAHAAEDLDDAGSEASSAILSNKHDALKNEAE